MISFKSFSSILERYNTPILRPYLMLRAFCENRSGCMSCFCFHPKTKCFLFQIGYGGTPVTKIVLYVSWTRPAQPGDLFSSWSLSLSSMFFFYQYIFNVFDAKQSNFMNLFIAIDATNGWRGKNASSLNMKWGGIYTKTQAYDNSSFLIINICLKKKRCENYSNISFLHNLWNLYWILEA